MAGGIGPYTGSFEAMRTWSNWHETITPIGFINGHADVVPTRIGPFTMTSKDYGGLAEIDPKTGVLSVGGYLGMSGKTGRAGGAGGYISVTWGSCPAP